MVYQRVQSTCATRKSKLHENMGLTRTTSNPPFSAQRTSRVGRGPFGNLQVPSRTPFGEPGAPTPTWRPAALCKAAETVSSPDRLPWAWLCEIWTDRLAIGAGHRQDATVIAWHRKGFRLFWTRKIRRGKPGRAAVRKRVRACPCPDSAIMPGQCAAGRTSRVEQKFRVRECFAPQARAVRRIARVYTKTEMVLCLMEGTSQRRLPGPRIAGRTVGGEVLPNVLPLPRKSSPKQDEPRAIRMSYVIE